MHEMIQVITMEIRLYIENNTDFNTTFMSPNKVDVHKLVVL